MATPVCMKRMRREREQLEKLESDEFCVHFKDEDLLHFTAFISGPEDSLYRHKFLKFEFEIPSNYPLVPPKVTYVQLSGGRIHPNLYVEGKVCLSILGTWPGEPWATAMTVESILITIRSLLDNKPYMHEPNQKDNPAFNDYVRYTTWQCLLLDHLQYEQDPKLRDFMTKYLQEHRAAVLGDIKEQARGTSSSVRSLKSFYGMKWTDVDYSTLISKLEAALPKANTSLNTLDTPVNQIGIQSSSTSSASSTDSLAPTNTYTSKSGESSPLKRKVSEPQDGDKGQPIELDANDSKKHKSDSNCVVQ